MDGVTVLENALGAQMLRAKLLGAAPVRLAGRYVIQNFLGRGASGVVVAAHDERLGREVALKLALAGADEHELAEARALARLDHPNVVRVIDAEHTQTLIGNTPFRLRMVVMQQVPGRSLRAWLGEQSRSTTEILDAYLAAGAGLAAAHAQRIVHRDFKPDNVIVRDDGVVQVVDFGFAVADVSSQLDGRAPTHEVAGTERYLAPEARAGRISAKSDQFAFAVSVIESLGAEPGDPGRPDGVEPRLWTALRRACAAEPNDRFPSMQALLASLRPVHPGRTRWRWVAAIAAGAVTWSVVAVLGGAESSCGRLPRAWRFETHLAPGCAVYGVIRDSDAGCSGTIERLCERGKQYGDGAVKATWTGSTRTGQDGEVELEILDVQLRNPGAAGDAATYDFKQLAFRGGLLLGGEVHKQLGGEPERRTELGMVRSFPGNCCTPKRRWAP